MASSENAFIDIAEEKYEIENSIVWIQKDSRYAWLVCFCCFTSQVFILGVLHAFGVFFVEFLQSFGSTKAEAAWIGSLAYGLSMIFCPITSFLLNRFGYRLVMVTGGFICAMSVLISSFVQDLPMMLFTFSVLYGIGTSMATQPTMTIASDYFDKYLIFAVGVTVSGGSFGTLIISPVSQALIDSIGWRNTFRFFAGTCTLTALLDLWIKPARKRAKRPVQNILTSPARRMLEEMNLWKNRVFVIWVIAITCAMFGFYIPYVHLVSFAFHIGIPPEKGSFIMVLFGGCTACGTLVFGKIVELKILNRLHMHQFSMVVTGTAIMLLPLAKSLTGVIIYVVVVGLVDGCFVVLLPILTTTLVGLENAVLAWGFLIGVSSITFTLGPPIAGNVYDQTGSYDIAFHCSGIPIIIGAIVLFLIPWAQRTSTSTNALIQLKKKEIEETDKISNSLSSYGTEGITEELIDHHGVHVRTVCTSTKHVDKVDRSTCTSPNSLFAQYPFDAEVKSIQPDFKEEVSSISKNIPKTHKIPFISPPNQSSGIGTRKGLSVSHTEGISSQYILSTAKNSSVGMKFKRFSPSSCKNGPPDYFSQTQLQHESSLDSRADSPKAIHKTSTQVFDIFRTESKSESDTDLRSALHPRIDNFVASSASKDPALKKPVLNQAETVKESNTCPLLSEDIEIIYVDGTRSKNPDEVFRGVKSPRLYSPPRRITPSPPRLYSPPRRISPSPPRLYSPAGRFSPSPPRLYSPSRRISPSPANATAKCVGPEQISPKDTTFGEARVREDTLGQEVQTDIVDESVAKVTKGDERARRNTRSKERTSRTVSYCSSDEEEDEADMFIHLFNDDVDDD
ncbi:hypothetical protein CHS0354_036545 [Potamilus streckersoni]|uniref:Major facilitator superfamily (MFS) profile domain-containing protein n=1 Tax=Potamilus streckersoni TaxID=2493646 RepID=A0AAE0TA87_9BIVA|nr:hypothetical protein CHS0354_036545 [Potamilus streckersoni]